MKWTLAVLALLLASRAVAQDSSASKNIQSSSDQGTPALSPRQAVITNQDVIGMLKAGLSPEIVAAKVKNSNCQCDTSPAGLAALKVSGVPDSVILALVQSASTQTEKPQGLADIKEAKSVYLVSNGTLASLRQSAGEVAEMGSVDDCPTPGRS